MKNIHPEDLETAFLPRGAPMFSELIERLGTDAMLSATRRRDLVSGLRRVAKAVGRPPEEVPADAQWLQPRLSRITPAALGLTPKSWQNAISDARAALVHFGLADRRTNRAKDLGPAWRALWAAVLASGDKTLQPALCRFVHFLDRHRIPPEEVRQEHAIAYRDALALNEISKSPAVAYRAAVNGWNLAAGRIDIWPGVTLPMPSRQTQIIRPIGTFPEGFGMDLDRLIAALQTPDPFSERGRQKALRPATCAQYRRQLHRFASELVDAGVDINAITGIDALLEPAVAERGLRQMLGRSGNKSTRAIADMAGLLRNLANTEGKSPEDLEALARLARRLALPAQTGMTRKNRERLRVLQDAGRQRKLLRLPEKLFAAAGSPQTAFAQGLLREDALAIALLLVCPVRIKNIAGIHLEDNLHRPGDGRAYLVFEDEETKTARPIEFELPADIRRMIDRHLARRSPALCPPGIPWLFPQRDGRGPVDPNQLSARIRRRIRRETGLDVNAHLFRHFAVMIWLDANPGAYEAARRLLGHSAVSHTINMYSGLESTSAIRAYAELVTTRKGRPR